MGLELFEDDAGLFRPWNISHTTLQYHLALLYEIWHACPFDLEGHLLDHIDEYATSIPYNRFR